MAEERRVQTWGGEGDGGEGSHLGPKAGRGLVVRVAVISHHWEPHPSPCPSSPGLPNCRLHSVPRAWNKTGGRSGHTQKHLPGLSATLCPLNVPVSS
jgi:hypothetical protein